MEGEQEPTFHDVITYDNEYKSMDFIKAAFPTIGEYAIHVLYLRFNEGILTEREKEDIALIMSRLKSNKASSQLSELFVTNKENTIECQIVE